MLHVNDEETCSPSKLQSASSASDQDCNALHLYNIVISIHCDLLACRPQLDLVTPYHIIMLCHGDAMVSRTSYTTTTKERIVSRMKAYLTEVSSTVNGATQQNKIVLPMTAEPWYLTRLMGSEHVWTPLNWSHASPTQYLLLTRNLERFINNLEEFLSLADVLVQRLERCWPLVEGNAEVRQRYHTWKTKGFQALYHPSAHWLRSPWFACRDLAMKELLELYELTGRQLSKQSIPYKSQHGRSIDRLLSTRHN